MATMISYGTFQSSDAAGAQFTKCLTIRFMSGLS